MADPVSTPSIEVEVRATQVTVSVHLRRSKKDFDDYLTLESSESVTLVPPEGQWTRQEALLAAVQITVPIVRKVVGDHVAVRTLTRDEAIGIIDRVKDTYERARTDGRGDHDHLRPAEPDAGEAGRRPKTWLDLLVPEDSGSPPSSG